MRRQARPAPPVAKVIPGRLSEDLGLAAGREPLGVERLGHECYVPHEEQEARRGVRHERDVAGEPLDLFRVERSQENAARVFPRSHDREEEVASVGQEVRVAMGQITA